MIPRTLLVLGGGGFLGHHLVAALLRRGRCDITAVDRSIHRLEPLRAAGGSGRLRVVQGSVTDMARMQPLVAESEAVLSLTALCNPSLYNTQPVEVIRSNYDDLAPLVELCAQHQRWLLHFSTCEVYGKPEAIADGVVPLREDETALTLGPIHRERWTYACAKQLLERLIWAYGAHQRLPFTMVRPFNVIGPQMDYLPGVDGEGTPRVLACFVRALLANEPLMLVDGGAQRRSFVDVTDFADGVLRMLERRASCEGEVFNLGNPANDVSIAELAQAMRRHYLAAGGRHDAGFAHVAAEQFYGPGYDDVAVRLPDISKARERLGWEPRLTLDEMLPAIIADYGDRYGSRIAARTCLAGAPP